MMLAACVDNLQNENDQPGEPSGALITETITARVNEGGTKATIDDDYGFFSWISTDRVAVHTTTDGYVVPTADPVIATTGTGPETVSTATFTISYSASGSRDAFAIYPSHIVATNATNYGQDDHTLDVTLPASYTLAEVSGETSPCPMIASNTGTSWEFKQLCGLLRLTANSIPSSTKRLEIDFNGKKVCGEFSIASPVTPDASDPSDLPVIENSTTTGTDDIITITKDKTDVVLGQTSLVLNIPLPVGSYSNITLTAYDAISEGNIIFTTTRPFAYTVSRKGGTKRTVTFPSSKTAFRGYEVSTGILERSKVGDNPATYSLTAGEMIMTYDNNGKEIYALPAGCNPFEPAVNYGQASALNKYYNKWLILRTELGADGNNINATSEKLPAGWRFPSSGGSSHEPGYDWGNILFGAPKSPITVNGETLKKIDYQYYTPFALVAVTLEAGNGYSIAAGTYYGLFLFRDGLTIPEGYFSKIGISANYTDNPLNETQFNNLVRMGCLFISASGYYSESFSWRDLSSSDPEGYYWSNIYSSDTNFLRCNFYNSHVAATGGSNTSNKEYYVVKLVKPVNP